MVIPEVALIVMSIVISASNAGQGGVIVGVLPFIALILSTVGIILCATTFRKSDLIYTFSWIGLIASIVIWLFVAVLIVAGL